METEQIVNPINQVMDAAQNFFDKSDLEIVSIITNSSQKIVSGVSLVLDLQAALHRASLNNMTALLDVVGTPEVQLSLELMVPTVKKVFCDVRELMADGKILGVQIMGLLKSDAVTAAVDKLVDTNNDESVKAIVERMRALEL